MNASAVVLAKANAQYHVFQQATASTKSMQMNVLNAAHAQAFALLALLLLNNITQKRAMTVVVAFLCYKEIYFGFKN